MELRAFNSDKDFERIKHWSTDERIHAMWCANRFQFPLEKENFSETLETFSEKHGDAAYVAVLEGEPVGFFCYSFNAEIKEGMLKFVIVDPECRGKGIAKEMFTILLRHAFNDTEAEAVQLVVFPQNPRAKRFYEKMGFVERRTEQGAFAYKDEFWDRCFMVIKKEDFHE